MTSELRKRPFARPLFIWTMGVCWAACLPAWWLAGWAFALLLPLMPFLRYHNARDYPLYSTRHSWGIVFSMLFFLLAVAYSTYRLRLPDLNALPTLQSFCASLQFGLLQTIDRLNLSDSDKGVLATLTLGYRQDMEWIVRRRFSLSGAAHILSVSGFHVAVVYAFVRRLLFFLPEKSGMRYVKYALLLASVWLFAGISGLASPSIRSAFMLSLYLAGRMLHRQTDAYNTWAAAAFCMLVYNPFYLFDIGFELSFVAVLSILFFFKRVRAWFPLRNPWIQALWDWFAVSLAAQVYTLPLCFYYFGEVSSVALLTALPVTLLSTLLIPAALLWMILAAFGWDWDLLGSFVSLATTAFCLFIDRLGRVPALAASLPCTSLMLALFYAALLFLTLYIKWLKTANLIFSLLCFLFFFVALYARESFWFLSSQK